MNDSNAAESSKRIIIVREEMEEEEKSPPVEQQKRNSSVSIGLPLIKCDGINYEKETNPRNVTPRRYSNCNQAQLSPCAVVSSRNNMLLSQVVLDSIKSLPSSDPGSSSEGTLISSHASDDDSSQSSLENPLADNESSSENSVSSNSDNAKGGSPANAYHARLSSSARAKSYQN